MSPTFQLRCVSGDGTEIALPPTLAVYLWAGDDETNGGARLGSVRSALEDARDELAMIAPDAVCVHGSPSQLLARSSDGRTALEWTVEQLRALLPAVRVWIGVGCDGWIGEWRAGLVSDSVVTQPLQRCAALAAALSCEALVWNAESRWKHSPSDARSRAQLESLARSLMGKLCALAPRCAHVVSSFDHLGFHSAMPFEALLSGNVTAYTGQCYVARPGGAQRGALAARIASALNSQRAARAAGWLRDDLRDDNGGDASAHDMDVFATVQLYATDATELTFVLAESPWVLGWSVPLVREGGRSDPRDVEAAACASVIRRAVGAGPGAVRRFQQSAHGALVVDGIAGPATRAFALKNRSA
ncbi:MAG: peptidoglycan-binding domain-containing protein [Polyangiales bacterium]